MFWFLLILSLTAFSMEMKYCIQVAADKDINRISTFYERVKDFPHARVEYKEGIYLLRIGAEKEKENLKIILKKVKALFKDAYIKLCEINPENTVIPRKVIKTTYTLSQNNEELKEMIVSLKKEINKLRMEINQIKKNKNSNISNDLPLEKFAYSAGIFLGGLFIFTWILILLTYKKINASDVKNTSLLNDMLKLIKILNLLSKGNIVKMENGKLLIYDKNKEKWKEVE